MQHMVDLKLEFLVCEANRSTQGILCVFIDRFSRVSRTSLHITH